MEDLMNRINDEIVKQCSTKRDEQVIDDLLDIYKGKYKSYDDYLSKTKKINEVVAYKNNELMRKLVLDGSMVYEYFLDKQVLPKEVFEYILTKRLDTLITRCKIELCIELLNVDSINVKEMIKTKLKEILEVL